MHKMGSLKTVSSPLSSDADFHRKIEGLQARAASRCASCGAEFDCGMQSSGTEACWCAALPPLEPEPGRGCLCRSCLERELDARPPG